MLFNTAVYPWAHALVPTAWGNVVYPTPGYMVASCFDFWRGDIIYRFKILCSQYHKGRLEFSWSPTGTPGSAGDTTNKIYTKIVDISKCSDIEFRVPYMQNTAYKNCNVFSSATLYSTSVAIDGTSTNLNGVLTVKVVNKQTSPSASANITILMYVKGADNLEFACPAQIDARQQLYAIQSGELDYDEDVETVPIAVKDSSPDPNLNLIYQGEKVSSLRSLLNRAGYLFSTRYRAVPALVLYSTSNTISRFPMIPGFDPNGTHGAIGPISSLSKNYNFVNWHPVTWFASCFVGHRGSINYHVSSNNSTVQKLTIDRERTTLTGLGIDSYVQLVNTSSFSEKAKHYVDTGASGGAGLTFTNPATQTAVSASVPMYSKFKFMSNDILTRTLGTTLDGSNQDSVTIKSSGFATNAEFLNGKDVYVAGGPDLSFVFFLNAPAIWRLNTLPTPTP
jgi:hypothetical protein